MQKTTLSVLAALVVLAIAGPAAAHVRLDRAVPDGRATLAPTLDRIRLFFSDALDIAQSGAALSDAGHHALPVGQPVLAGDDRREMIIPLQGPLASGKYTLAWHAVGPDGHRVEGSYTFAVSH